MRRLVWAFVMVGLVSACSESAVYAGEDMEPTELAFRLRSDTETALSDGEAVTTGWEDSLSFQVTAFDADGLALVEVVSVSRTHECENNVVSSSEVRRPVHTWGADDATPSVGDSVTVRRFVNLEARPDPRKCQANDSITCAWTERFEAEATPIDGEKALATMEVRSDRNPECG